VEPLTWLLRKAGFHWSEETETVFHALQWALTTAPVLQLPDFDRDFVVECDTSGSDVRAVLHQGGRPVTFFSCQMVPHHTNLAAYEHELNGLVQAIKHWHTYLWG
jgi:hypothetical protein